MEGRSGIYSGKTLCKALTWVPRVSCDFGDSIQMVAAQKHIIIGGSVFKLVSCVLIHSTSSEWGQKKSLFPQEEKHPNQTDSFPCLWGLTLN